MRFPEVAGCLHGHDRISFTAITRDAEIMLELMQRAGFTVEREALTNRIGPTTHRLAKRLGFEGMD